MKISELLFLPLIFAKNLLILLASLAFINFSLVSLPSNDNSKISKNELPIYHYAQSSIKIESKEHLIIRYGWNLEKNGKILFPKMYQPRIQNILITAHSNRSSNWDQEAFLKEWRQSLIHLKNKFPELKSIQLDFEGYKERDAEKFYSFVCNTFSFINSKLPGLNLNLAFFPPYHPDNHGFHNWRFKERCFHKIFVMMYDYHNPRTRPGEVTNDSWIRNNLEEIHKLAIQLNKSDLIIGLPLYGYIWDRSGKFVRHITLKESNQWKKVARLDRLTKNGEIIYPHKEEFNFQWEREALRLGYGGIVYWRYGYGK